MEVSPLVLTALKAYS
jgi:hypothetical protein